MSPCSPCPLKFVPGPQICAFAGAAAIHDMWCVSPYSYLHSSSFYPSHGNAKLIHNPFFTHSPFLYLRKNLLFGVFYVFRWNCTNYFRLLEVYVGENSFFRGQKVSWRKRNLLVHITLRGARQCNKPQVFRKKCAGYRWRQESPWIRGSTVGVFSWFTHRPAWD